MTWIRHFLLPVLAIAAAPAPTAWLANATQAQSVGYDDPQVVVLTNLSVMRGSVTLTERGIRLVANSGSTLDLDHRQVLALAESLDEAYPQVLRRMNLDDDQELQRLFRWCLQNHLPHRAAAILASAQLGSHPPKLLDGLQRQLALYRPPEPPAEVASPILSDATAAAVALNERQSAAQLEKQIDTALAQLPDNAERYFNRELQPKLIAGCAAAQCHHAQRSGLALWHDGHGHVGIRGYSRRNLFQVLQWVDVDQPAESELLLRARTAHGNPPSQPWVVDSQEYQLLEYWTYALSRDPTRYYAEVVLPSVVAATPSPPEPAVDSKSTPTAEIATVGFEEAPSPVSPDQLLESGRPLPLPAQLIPCDPLPFNRKYHPQRREN